MKRAEYNPQSGKSLFEMLIVLAVTGILVTMAVIQLGSSQSNLERQNIARELKINLERARFDSVKRRADTSTTMARVTLINATSFSTALDLNQNNIIDTAETRTVDLSVRSNVRIVGNNLNFPITITFDRHGHAEATDSTTASITPTFILCTDNCTPQTANSTNANVIALSSTGTVAMFEGGGSLPTIQAPTISNISSNSNMNPLVLVNTSTNSQ